MLEYSEKIFLSLSFNTKEREQDQAGDLKKKRTEDY